MGSTTHRHPIPAKRPRAPQTPYEITMKTMPHTDSTARTLFYAIAESIGPLPIPRYAQPAANHLHEQNLIRPYKDGYILTPSGMDYLLHPYR